MADDDAMVAAREDIHDAAVQPGERVIQHGRACSSGVRGGVTEVAARLGVAREAGTQVALILAQQVDGEVAVADHHLMQIRRFLDTDKDERRTEGERGERVDGDAEAALVIAGGYYGHA